MSEWNDASSERDRLLSAQCTSPPPQPLSVSYKDIGLSQFLFENMWSKAAKLVSIEGGIVKAPLSENSWMVASQSRRKPNYIINTKESIFTCDCSGYHEKSICSHTLAVAESEGHLQSMLGQFVKAKKCPRLTNLAYRDMPSHPGEKPGTRHRTRTRIRAASRSASGNVKRRKLPDEEKRSRMDSKFILRDLHGTHIRMCYGCGNAIRIPPHVPAPPYDIVVARKELRNHKDKEGYVKVTSREEYVHYHSKMSCILNRNGTFSGSDILIPQEIRSKLCPIHWAHLQKEFGI